MITFLIVSLIFFFLGRYTVTKHDVEIVKGVLRKVGKLKLGAVKRPTAEMLRKRGTKEEAGNKAMEETLEEILK